MVLQRRGELVDIALRAQDVVASLGVARFGEMGQGADADQLGQLVLAHASRHFRVEQGVLVAQEVAATLGIELGAHTGQQHAGAVRALTEAKLWTEAAQKHNEGLLKRQATLANAWKDYLKTNTPEDRDQFRAGWMKMRAAALTKAGMEVLFQ